MDLMTWLRTLLARHPLKEPMAHDPARYTAQVMERVKAIGQPALAPGSARPWFFFVPRVGLVLATVAAALALMIGLRHSSDARMTQQALQDSSVLAQLDGANGDSVSTNDVDALADDLEHLDTMVLAQSEPSDDQWIQRNLQLLDQLGEAPSDDPAGGASSDEDWLRELQQLDEGELSTPS